MPACHKSEKPSDLALTGCTAFPEHSLPGMPGCFYNLGIIEERQRLQGRARALAAHGADIAISGVEGDHRRVRHGSLPKSIKTPPIQIGTFSSVVLWPAHGNFPQALRLIGLDTGTSKAFH